jgi:hypothetical protein
MYGKPVHHGPVEPDALIDRRLELDALQRAAAHRVAIRLAAPRRFGKTSLRDAHILDPLFREWLRRR